MGEVKKNQLWLYIMKQADYEPFLFFLFEKVINAGVFNVLD